MSNTIIKFGSLLNIKYEIYNDEIPTILVQSVVNDDTATVWPETKSIEGTRGEGADGRYRRRRDLFLMCG